MPNRAVDVRRVDPPDGGRLPAAGRLPPAMAGPAAVVRREDGVATAVGLANPPWCHRIRRARRDELDALVLQRLRDGVIPLAAVGTVVRGHMNGAGADSGGDLRDHPLRAAVHDQQPPAHALGQVGQTAGQKCPSGRAGRLQDGIVGDENAEHIGILGRGGQQRRMIRESQVAPEPEHSRGRHTPIMPGPGLRQTPAAAALSGRRAPGNPARCSRCRPAGGGRSWWPDR